MVTISKESLIEATEQMLAVEENGLEYILKLINYILNEQLEIATDLCKLGKDAPAMFKGFILAYLAIRAQLEKDELTRLEKIGAL